MNDQAAKRLFGGFENPMSKNPMSEKPETPDRTTPLYELHLELKAKIVTFAGYQMPVQYPAGIIREHQHTRARAGLFDVSHMGQVRLPDAGADEALEALMPVDVQGLAPGRQRYGLFTNDEGGILDDLMVSRFPGYLLVVVNAACKEADIARLQAHFGSATVEVLTDRALLALQGPASGEVLAQINPAVSAMRFMDVQELDLDGAACMVSRSGYSGEDGFEISVPAAAAQSLARRLLGSEAVAPVGLGARDSLRLEAGLCLYGHDLDTDTTPVEAGLTWAISKARRQGGARPGGFPGAHTILAQLADGAARHRVGIRPQCRAPVREGTQLLADAEPGDGLCRFGPPGRGHVPGGPGTGQAPAGHGDGVAVCQTELLSINTRRPLSTNHQGEHDHEHTEIYRRSRMDTGGRRPVRRGGHHRICPGTVRRAGLCGNARSGPGADPGQRIGGNRIRKSRQRAQSPGWRHRHADQ